MLTPAFQAQGLNVVHLLQDGTGILDPGHSVLDQPETLF